MIKFDCKLGKTTTDSFNEIKLVYAVNCTHIFAFSPEGIRESIEHGHADDT